MVLRGEYAMLAFWGLAVCNEIQYRRNQSMDLYAGLRKIVFFAMIVHCVEIFYAIKKMGRNMNLSHAVRIFIFGYYYIKQLGL